MRDGEGNLLDARGRILTVKGAQPAKHWSDRRAIRTGRIVRNPELVRLPWLGPQDLVAMGGTVAESRNRSAARKVLQRTRKAARDMYAADDLIFIENDHRHVRVEPPDWWGDPRGPIGATDDI